MHWDAEDPALRPDIRDLGRRAGARTIVAIPIYADGDPIGSCVVAAPEEQPLTAVDESLLETALGVLGIVYRRGTLKELEEEHQHQAIQAHNLAAVGELAAGVAHEINNPLSTIVHFCELLREEVGGEAREHVQAVMDEALRAAATVRSLQAFARQETGPGRYATSVEQAIQAIVDLEKHQLAVSNVDLRLEIEPDLPPVRADAAHLRRVLYNLLSNARHAIRQTGAPGEVLARASRVGAWVEITIEDTGTGITRDVAGAMFRPFFTTKPPGEGTGLGLAVAYGMVREHGGQIEAANWGRPPVEGGGPCEGGGPPDRASARGRRAPDGRARGATEGVAPPRRGLSILVVEDEPQVARSVTALLMREGHRAFVARIAEEAVARLAAEGDAFAVILSDFRMPGMGGEGLHDWIGARHPEWMERLVFTSGDLLSPRTQAFLESAGRPVLTKPFTLDALRAALAPYQR